MHTMQLKERKTVELWLDRLSFVEVANIVDKRPIAPE